jgi:glyoxylase I family protein
MERPSTRVTRAKREDADGHMAVEVLGLDHLYITVSDLRRSEQFYDVIMERFGFRKGDSAIGGDPHAHYFNRYLQYTIRPARSRTTPHDPYAPGLHHVCFQVPNRDAVDEAHQELIGLGIPATEPREYPEYNDDYYATFFSDPDGIRLEFVARSRTREEISASWSLFRVFLNPLADLRARRGTR